MSEIQERKVFPKSGRYTQRVRAGGYKRKQRVLTSKKVIFDAPIITEAKRDAFGQFRGSRRVRVKSK